VTIRKLSESFQHEYMARFEYHLAAIVAESQLLLLLLFYAAYQCFIVVWYLCCGLVCYAMSVPLWYVAFRCVLVWYAICMQLLTADV
jgi:hypothetical protein